MLMLQQTTTADVSGGFMFAEKRRRGSKHHKQNTEKIWQFLFDRKVGDLFNINPEGFSIPFSFVLAMFFQSTDMNL